MDVFHQLPLSAPEEAGILAALAGTLFVISLTALIAVPLGVAAAIYLEEYGGKGRIARLIEINIANLAGVPSIIYGLLGLGLFVRLMHMERSVLAGASTLALLVLPVIILATREALRAVPSSLREGSYALGATKWQTILHQVLPAAIAGNPDRPDPGRFARRRRDGAADHHRRADLRPVRARRTSGRRSRCLPIQIFNWVSRPQAAFAENAAAGIVVLLGFLLIMNAMAIYIRDRLQQKLR